MPLVLSFDNQSYTLPTRGETDWATLLNAFLTAVAGGAATLGRAGPAVLVFGASSHPANTSNNYLWPGFANDDADAVELFVRAPVAGFLNRMKVQAVTGPATQGVDFTVRVNGVDTGLSVTLGASATQAGIVSESPVGVDEGDRISVKVAGVSGISGAALFPVVSMAFTLG